MKLMLILALLLNGCFGAEKPTVKDAVPPKEKTPPLAATGKNFKMALHICKPYNGVAFVAAGDKFKAECRDGLKISRDEVKK